MSNVKFRYNHETCRYEPYRVTGKVLRRRAFVFFSLSFMLAMAGYFWVRNYFETLEELSLERKNQALKIEWDLLSRRVQDANQQLAYFIEKDDKNYRVILDSPPLEASIREAGVGGSERVDYSLISDYPMIAREYASVEKLKHQVEVELQSYQELDKMLAHKMSMWAARPAIQPLSNKDVIYVHTRYGPRMHPLLGFVRDHRGLDFTADKGTPVYATGDGVVKMAYYSQSYGNVIFLDHGFGYETRYAHLSDFNVRKGQRVKRGELIGFVGNTGLSGGPHLHYEVLLNDEHVNPIHFFQRDLSRKEFQKIIDQVKE